MNDGGAHAELEELRDDLLHRLGGAPSGLPAALVVVDQVHLRRLVRGVVPAVIATANLFWYDAYRGDVDPHAGAVDLLRPLFEAWRRNPGERNSVEERMRQVAVGVVGERPDDLLDAVV